MTIVFLDRIYRNLLKKVTFKRGLICFFGFLFLFEKSVLWLHNCQNYQQKKVEDANRPTYMLHGDNVDSGYLKHVIAVLERIGFQRVENSSDFDLLWSHVYPFGDLAPFSKTFLQNLKPYQKVLNLGMKSNF